MIKNYLSNIFFILIPLLVIIIGILSYLTAMDVFDDSFMFYRYAVNLIDTGEMRWNPSGNPVYGLTSILYLIIVIPFTFLLRNYPAIVMVLSSFVCGIAFILLLNLLLKKYSGLGGKYVLPFILIILSVSAKYFTPHFTTGMDTFFGMAYFTIFIMFLKKYESGKLNLIYVVICGVLLFWVRPELIIFPFLSLIFLFFEKKSNVTKKDILVALFLLFILFFTLISFSNILFGSYLPLPFYAKVANSYGKEFNEVYRLTPYLEIKKFLFYNWILFTLSAIGIFFRKIFSINFSSIDKSLFLGTIIFLIFNIFFVTQIMSSYQRFYYPILPVLFYISAKCFDAVLKKQKSAKSIFKQKSLYRFKFITTIIVSVSVVYGMQQFLTKFITDVKEQRFSRLDNKTVYEIKHSKVLFGLDKLMCLPSDLKIATTEVGFCSAFNLNKDVIDLAGLNDKNIAINGFKVDIFFSNHQPDVLFLPWPDYKEMISDIIYYPYFKENYDYFSSGTLGTITGASIYKKSKYYNELKKIFSTY